MHLDSLLDEAAVSGEYGPADARQLVRQRHDDDIPAAEELSDAEIDRQIAINLTGSIQLIRSAVL